MAFVEEVFKIGGREPGLYGGHTGHKYDKSCVEEINGQLWSKPYHFQPNSITFEVAEAADDVEKENTQKPGGNPY